MLGQARKYRQLTKTAGKPPAWAGGSQDGRKAPIVTGSFEARGSGCAAACGGLRRKRCLIGEMAIARKAVAQMKEDGFRMEPRSPFPPPPERGPGRQPIADIEYARVARDYVAATKNPVTTVAKAWGRRPAWVTSRIARARRYGFLTPAIKHGVRGGSLTDKARAVLESAKPRK